MPILKFNQAEFFYEIHGEGHPLVLIAGYTCDHTFWFPILKQLSRHFKVLLFDNRGVGRTKDHAKQLSVKLMAEDVIALIQALNLHQPHIVGQSMGGTIAQYLAAHYGEQLNKIVILSSSAKWRQAALMGFKSHIQMRESKTNLDDLFLAIIPWIFGETFLKNSRNIKALKNDMLQNIYPQSLENQKRQYQALLTFNGIENLSLIHSPILICYGGEDIIALPDESKFLAAHISNSLLKEFKFSAHGLVSEESKNLSELLINFLL